MSPPSFFKASPRRRGQRLMNAGHFTLDNSLTEARASLKNLRTEDEAGPGRNDADPSNPSVDFPGEKRSNQTHRSYATPKKKPDRRDKNIFAVRYGTLEVARRRRPSPLRVLTRAPR
jgi:hypothetical protein